MKNFGRDGAKQSESQPQAPRVTLRYMALTAPNLALLADAVKRYLVSGSTETPLDPTAVIPELASVAVSSGFATGTGQFTEAVKNRPFSTLISFIAFVGGSGVVLPKAS